MSPNSFVYSVFGLTIESNFKIFFLQNLKKKSSYDLKVILNRSFNEPKNLHSLRTVFTRNYIYYIDNHDVIFRISERGTIEIKNCNNTNEQDIVFSLVGIPIGYFFFLKGLYVNHASTITKGRNAISFLGQTNSGKSSLSNFFLSKNFKFVSEDLCLINEKQIIDRSSNWIKLSKDIFKGSIESFLDFKLIPGDKRKREFCILKDNLIFNGRAKLKLCYVPIWGDDIKISKLDNEEAFKFLLTNSYRPKNYKKTSKLEEITLKNITNFIENVECFRFSRKKDMKYFDKSNNFLLSHIEQTINS